MEREARARERCNPYLSQLEAPRHHRLIEAVGELATETREEEERRDEDSARQCDQCLGILASDFEQDQEDERILQEVVVEGRKELAPEQRCEAAGGHQRCGHSADPLANVPFGSPRMPVWRRVSLNRTIFEQIAIGDLLAASPLSKFVGPALIRRKGDIEADRAASPHRFDWSLIRPQTQRVLQAASCRLAQQPSPSGLADHGLPPCLGNKNPPGKGISE